ncbi:MAG: D-alanyl-D-alanine carboxypeptidase family protein [Candidatus Moraniibacteriota bacterium]|jgi:serine-type D-Ala-D-Ala carboxypeptidase (penicillin-binding protein 5/6)
MTEELSKKQQNSLVTYPVAVFVFFAFIIGVSIFVQKNDENIVKNEEIELRKDNQVSKEKIRRMKTVLSKQNDIITEVISQPVKKEDFYNLSVEDAHAGIIFDTKSGTILWEKNSTERRSIASITKLVTAMVVIDRIRDLNEVVVIPESVMRIEGTKVGCPTSVICNAPRLQVGEKVRVKDLLRAMLMFSANDVATTLAIHIAGSEEEFAKLMNARMKEVGAGNTNFCRPSGLELDENEESCYSSAYDIARVVAHLRKHDKYSVLWDIMKTKEGTFTSVDGEIVHELKNTNRLVGEMDNLVGAKTGFTPRAGYCLALTSTSTDKEHDIVSIVLDDYQRFNDVQKMSEWAFENYVWK